MADRINLNMVLPEARANYAYVFKPRPSEEPGKEGSYSITLAIPKSAASEKGVAEIKKMILTAAKAKWPTDALEWLRKGKLANPLHDGDDMDDVTMHGHWVMTARRKESFGAPGVVDAAVQRIMDPTEFYSGCFCYASVSFFPYDNKGKKGVGCGLNNLQKIRDGERIGGKTDPKQDFKPLAPVSGSGPIDEDDEDAF